MKQLGYVLIALGFALLVFVIYSFFAENNRLRSPIPEEKGVKVIFISPTK